MIGAEKGFGDKRAGVKDLAKGQLLIQECIDTL